MPTDPFAEIREELEANAPSLEGQLGTVGTEKKADADPFAQIREELAAASEPDPVIRENLALARDRSPEKVGRAVELKRKVPEIPLQVIEADPEQFQRELDSLSDPAFELSMASNAIAQLARDPDMAAVIRDDASNLIALDKAVRDNSVDALFPDFFEDVANRYRQGDLTTRMSKLSFREMMGNATAAELHELKQLEGSFRDVPRRPGLLSAIAGASAEQVPLRISGFKRGAKDAVVGGLAGGILGTAVPGAGTLAGAGLGAKAGFLAGNVFDIFEIETGATFQEMKDIRLDNGEPIPREAAVAAAVLAGSASTGLEFLSLTRALKLVPGGRRLMKVLGSPAAAGRVIRETPGLRAFLTQFGKDYLTAIGTEGVTEASQEAIQIAASNYLVRRYINPDQSLLPDETQRPRVFEAGREGGFATIGLGAAGGAARGVTATLANVQQRKLKARLNAVRLERIAQAAEKAKTRERAPESFDELLNTLAADASIEDVGIKADKLVELFQANGKTVDEMFVALPDLEDQLQPALDIGGDVYVSVADFTRVVAPQTGEGIFEHVRLGGDDTVAEVNALEAEDTEAIEREAARLDSQLERAFGLAEASDIFASQIQQQLVEAQGMTQDAAAQVAAVARANFETRAADLGVDPRELLRQNVRIVGPGEDLAAEPRTVREILADTGLAAALDRLRTGQEPGPARGSRKPIQSILRRAGGVRIGSPLASELSALGITQKTAPGLFRRDRGLSGLDEFDFANEPIFPTPPGDQDILDALDAEMRGQPLLTAEEMDTIQAAEQQREELLAVLDALGIDLNEASNEQVIERLGATRNLDQPVLHGTAAENIRRFDIAFVGTGEGAQAFGHGIYFTTEEGIARFYRDEVVNLKRELGGLKIKGVKDAMFSLPGELARDFEASAARAFSTDDARAAANQQGRMTKLAEEAVHRRLFDALAGFNRPDLAVELTLNAELAMLQDDLQRTERSVQQSIDRAAAREERGRVLPGDGSEVEGARFADAARAEFLRRQIAYLETLGPDDVELIEGTKGAIIEAEIPESDELLQWDKFMREQPESVRNALGAAADENPAINVALRGFRMENANGERFYRTLANELGSDAAASQALQEAGIPGLEYPAGTLSGGRADARNFVIWDNDAMQVLRRLEQQARASITFDPELRNILIRLSSASDLTSALHELWHLFILNLLQDAPRAGRQAEILQTLLDHLGLESADQITSEHHEQLATLAEVYFREGKAPSAELRDSFARFRQWFIHVYRTLVDLFQRSGRVVELNDDVRAAFDRMLATDAAIAQNREIDTFRALLADDDTLMTPAEKEQYLKLEQRALDEQRNRVDRITLAQLAREKKRWWKEEGEAIRPEVEARVNAIPVFRAVHWLKTGEDLLGEIEGTPRKLSRDSLIRLYGDQTILRSLDAATGIARNRAWQSEGGIDAEVAADLFGFQSPDMMVGAILNAGKRKDVIEAEIQRELKERHGDVINDGTLEEEAYQKATNRFRNEFLIFENRILARASGKAHLAPRTVIREAAKDRVRGTVISRLRPHRHRQMAETASREAIQAQAEGDMSMAADATRRRIINLYLETESRRALDHFAVGLSYLKKFKRKKIQQRIGKSGGDHLDQILGMLDQVELRRLTAEETLRRKNLSTYADEQIAAGYDVIIPEDVALEAGRKPAREMTVEEFQGVVDTVRNIEAIARQEREARVGAETVEYESIEAEALESISRVKRTKSLREQGLRPTVRGLRAMLTKAETVVKFLGNDNPNFILQRAVIEPLRAAAVAHERRMNEYQEKVGKILGSIDIKEYKRALNDDRILDLDGRPLRLNKFMLMSIALNMGNESNLAKLLGGYHWDERVLREVIDDYFVEADWVRIQALWDTIDELWDDISTLERIVTGVAPPRVQARAVQTQFGRFRGGYYPVVYDAALGRLGQENEQSVWPTARRFSRVMTGHGFTMARTEVTAPLDLSLGVIGRHLDMVLLDLTHRQAVMQADKILRSEKLDAAIQQKLGTAFSYGKFWKPWLQQISRDVADPRGLGSLQSLFRTARLRSSVYALGLNMVTLATQPAGLMNGFRFMQDELGLSSLEAARFFAGGLAKTLRRPLTRADAEFVFENSGTMRLRAESWNRDARDVLNQVTDAGQTPGAAKFAMGMIGRIQLNAVDMPVWLASYSAARRIGHDVGHERAAAMADSIVIQSQGSGFVMDQSAIETQSEFVKSMAMFYSYNNAVFNQVQRSVSHLRDRPIRNAPRFMVDMAFYLMGPALYYHILRFVLREAIPAALAGKDVDDDDIDRFVIQTGAAALGGEFLSTIPIIRDYWETGLEQLTGMDVTYFTQEDVSTAFGHYLGQLSRQLKATNKLLTEEEYANFMRESVRSYWLVTGRPGGDLLRYTKFLDEE